MSDQNVITDWKAYFESLGPREPYSGPTHCDPYPGAPAPRIVYVRPGSPHSDLEMVDVPEGENLFEVAKEVYEANSGPEMWIFSHTGGQPWHVDARPKPKKGARPVKSP